MLSLWEKETFFAPQDVVIVGSGFAGLWSALFLKKKHPKAKVTLLDRGLIPTGASTRNAGFACFGSLTELVHDAETMGLDKMLALVEMRFRGLEIIHKQFSPRKFDYDPCGGYELFIGAGGLPSEKLDHYISYLNSLLKSITGSKKTFRREDEKIAAFGFGNTAHLVKNTFEGSLHSGKLVQVLLRKVQAMGVQVFNGIAVTGFEPTAEGIGVITSAVRFSTKQLLLCTNAFANELLPEANITPARGQVVVTSPIENLRWKGTFHFDEGYYYFRNVGNRVLLGGARNKDFDGEQTTSFETSETIQAELERFLREVILPNHKDTFSIEHRWSGIMGMGTEKLPIVKEVQPRVFCALGMGGIGVAIAPVIGQQASRQLLG
jgi:glycine/D-amino acid oxidase-like deaminating enzyme